MDILYLSPHPDDDASWSAGTIYTLLKQNNNIFEYVFTKGGKGTLNPNLRGSPLRKIREQEALEFRKKFHLAKLEFLDYYDQGLPFNKKIVSEILNLLLNHSFSVVFAPYHKKSWLKNHIDHINLGKAALKAVKLYNQEKNINLTGENQNRGFLPLMQYHSQKPNCFVDVSHLSYKIYHYMQDVYRSQWHTLMTKLPLRYILSYYYGRYISSKKAEGFYLSYPGTKIKIKKDVKIKYG
ncbi:MAG: hypothetical protein GF364_22265 [Candidatus Lokiarchaeota archaeon]|nr:hypothetical protein [Candidatus Lokiarchaeota archaeon]